MKSGFPPRARLRLGQTQNYQLSTEGYLQSASANNGALGGVQENSKPVYQAQPNPQNYFIEQIPARSQFIGVVGRQSYGDPLLRRGRIVPKRNIAHRTARKQRRLVRWKRNDCIDVERGAGSSRL